MLPFLSSTVAGATRQHPAPERLTRSMMCLCVAGLGLATVACETTPEDPIKTSATASGGSGGEKAASGGSATRGSGGSEGAIDSNGSASGGTGGAGSGGSGGTPWTTDSGGNGGTSSEAGAAGAQTDGAGGQAGEAGTEGSGGVGGEVDIEALCGAMCDRLSEKGCDGYNRASCMNRCPGGYEELSELGCAAQYAAETECVATADVEEFTCNEGGSVNIQLACLDKQCSLLRCWYYAEDYEFDVPECEGL